MIDIMLPFYGDVGLMQDAVRSVLAQDSDRWRLTVVDDSCDPAVPAWFDALADNRVRYFRNERNLGISGNFQRCVDLAEHPRMSLLGADDLLLPHYVRTVLSAITVHGEVGMVQPGVQVIDAQGNPAGGLADRVKDRLYAPRVDGARTLGGQELAVSLLRGNWLYFPSICWRTAAVKDVGFRDDLRTTQDLALELELIARGERMVVLDTVCFQYRRHTASVSSVMATDGDRFREERALFVESAARMRALGWSRAARAARTHSASRLHALTQLPGAVRGGQRTVAGQLVRHAFAPH